MTFFQSVNYTRENGASGADKNAVLGSGTSATLSHWFW
jgi:hypothetical protein